MEDRREEKERQRGEKIKINYQGIFISKHINNCFKCKWPEHPNKKAVNVRLVIKARPCYIFYTRSLF